MKNPRIYIRVDGRVPVNHPLRGYEIPFKFESIFGLIQRFTKDIEWTTIQIKITPSLLTNKVKILMISTEYKHINVPIDHMIMMFEDKTRELIASTDTLEDIFPLFDEFGELK